MCAWCVAAKTLRLRRIIEHVWNPRVRNCRPAYFAPTLYPTRSIHSSPLHNNSTTSTSTGNKMPKQAVENTMCPAPLSKEELAKRLSKIQLHVTQQKGTEAPFSGQYYDHHETGTYTCIVCGEQLFKYVCAAFVASLILTSHHGLMG